MALNFSTENLARTSATHPWRVVAIWVVVFLVAGFLIATLLKDGETTKFVFTGNPEVKQGLDLLEDEIRGPTGTNEIVVIESSTFTVDDPQYQQVVESLTSDLAALGPEIIRLETLANFYSTGAPPLVSDDRTATLISFVMTGDFDDASENISEVVDTVRAAQGQEGFEILITGQATISLDQRELGQEDLEKGEAFGVPIALIILVVVLGALAAALIPLVMAIVSIVVALGVSALVGQAFELSFFVENIITMIGLAVGIDYSLFVVSRYREERGRGLEKIDAISQAGATATRAVIFSGMTVVFALVGMLLIPFNIFISVGTGAILVVLAAMAASMTLLPAILGIMGDRINSLRLPYIGRGQANFDPTESGGFWDKLVRLVMAQPVISLLLSGGLLIAAVVPFFGINTGFAGVSTFPDKLESKQAFLVLDEKFSFGEVTPAEIVIQGDIASPAVQAGIDRLRALLAADDAFSQPRDLEVSPSGKVALLAVPVAGGHHWGSFHRSGETAGQSLRGGSICRYPNRHLRHRRDSFQHRVLQHIVPLGLDRVPLRSGDQLPAPDGGVPLDPAADQGHHPQPVGCGSGLRHPGAGLPGGVPGQHFRVSGVSHHRGLDTVIPVHHPVRVVHGLPRLPAVTHPGAVRRDPGQRRVGRLWHPFHRTADHRRGPDHGRCLLGVCRWLAGGSAADGLWPGCSHPYWTPPSSGP